MGRMVTTMTEWALLAQSYIIQLISCLVNFFRKPMEENLRICYCTHFACLYNYCNILLRQKQQAPPTFRSAGRKSFVIFLWQIDGGSLRCSTLPGNTRRGAFHMRPWNCAKGSAARADIESAPTVFAIFYLARSSQNATAPAAATFSESTPCCMGIMTV